ncbi:MAG: glycosyltransferase [Deltaproteobacteria bacterium]|nr:glycosyltransferase [Deltaproteobacteria bacterium]
MAPIKDPSTENQSTSLPRLPLTCGYLVRNEGEFLEASLESVCLFADELIVFDSGSTDDSLKILEKFRNRVPKFQLRSIEWKNNFSEARNELSKLATNRWILFVDGDEILESSGYQKMAKLIQDEEADCYSLVQKNYTQDASIEGVKLVEDKNLPGLKNSSQPLYFFNNWMERLYRRDKGLAYEGRIHESLLPTCRRLNLKHSTVNIILHHYGRLKLSQAEKIKYYLNLTEQKVKEEPENVVAVIELITNLIEVGQFERAFAFAEDGVKKFSGIPEMWRSGFQAALRADQFQTAENWIQIYLKMKPQDIFALSQLTTALLYQKKFSDVLKLADDLLKVDPKNFVAHVNCGVIFYENQNWKKSLEHLNAALETKPSDTFLIEARKKVQEKINALQ